MTKLRTISFAIWKVFAGAVFCQFFPTALIVVGWTYRAMQRAAVRTWRAQSPLPPEETAALAMTDPVFRAHAAWPNWFLRQRSLRELEPAAPGIRAGLRRMARNTAGSLGTNLRIGFLGTLNTSVVMALPAILWQLGWYAGWDNSFNKGYEQYYTGIALSVIGIVLFLAAMLYLPMAQARQAVTGEWRAFYDLRTVWRIATGNPVRTLLLAAAFSLVALPINVLLVGVQFVDRSEAQRAMSDVEFLAFLNRYYFWVCVLGFLGYVLLRMLAARWYAGGVLATLRAGRLTPESLKGAEKHALSALALDRAGDPAQRHPVIAVTLTVSRPVWRTAMLSAAVAVWFSFVAQIYVREFFVYHPYRGFMNQPLVQVPWLRYVPAALQNEVRAAENR